MQKATSSDVKEFAQKMIEDHTKAGEKNSRPSLTSERGQRRRLEAAYIALQTKAHMEAVTLFGTYAGHPDDEAVGKFAEQTLPTLGMHLEHVKMLAAAH